MDFVKLSIGPFIKLNGFFIHCEPGWGVDPNHCIFHDALIGKSTHCIINVIVSKKHRLKGLFKSIYLCNTGHFRIQKIYKGLITKSPPHLSTVSLCSTARLLDLSHDQGHNQNHFLGASGSEHARIHRRLQSGPLRSL